MIDLETVYGIADRYDVGVIKIKDGMSITTRESQVVDWIQSNIMSKYDLTIKVRDGIYIIRFDECCD